MLSLIVLFYCWLEDVNQPKPEPDADPEQIAFKDQYEPGKAILLAVVDMWLLYGLDKFLL